MLSEERRQCIIEAVEDGGIVSVKDLAVRFAVSDMTVRRDLRVLEADGLIRRVYGGAITLRGRGFEPPFMLRAGQHSDETARIACRAVELVADGDTLALDVGTTVLELAKRLRDRANLTVVVTSLQAANELASHPSIRLIVAGGVLRYPELSLVSSLTERMLSDFYFDKVFLGASGISMDGITGFNLEDALVKSVLVQRAKQRIVLVDHTKFDSFAFRLVAPLSSIETIVTGVESNATIVAELHDRGIHVIQA
jgi:DeoR/GlpR family transcriptional regulator of sugar metabolism